MQVLKFVSSRCIIKDGDQNADWQGSSKDSVAKAIISNYKGMAPWISYGA